MRLLLVLTLLLLNACASAPLTKTSDYGKIFSPAMDREMEYSVYTPPGWTESESLPLMVLLHGAWDNHEAFDRYNVGQYLDQDIASGKLPRVIILNPDGERGFWENWKDGTRNYRDWVIQDLMPTVQRTYNTLPCPEHCFISGISMGAHGALRFAHHEASSFSSTAVISGIIFSNQTKREPSWKDRIVRLFFPIKRIWGDIDGKKMEEGIDPYVSWLQGGQLEKMDLFLAWGTDDTKSIIESSEKFHAHLEKNNRPHTTMVYTGEHKWVDWRPVIAESIRFHINDTTLRGSKSGER